MSGAPASSFDHAVETPVDHGAGPVGTLDARAISPELVLVSPDLRELVLAQLPERDPDGWIPRRFSVVPPPPLDAGAVVPIEAPARDRDRRG